MAEQRTDASSILEEATKLVEVYYENKKQLKQKLKEQEQVVEDKRNSFILEKNRYDTYKKDYNTAKKIYKVKADALLELHEVDFKIHRKYKYKGTEMEAIKARFERDAKSQLKKDSILHEGKFDFVAHMENQKAQEENFIVGFGYNDDDE